MTLLEKIAALPEISPETVKGNFTFEDFKFEIIEKMALNTPDYTGISTIFLTVDQEMSEDEVYDIIRERLTLKVYYLYFVYGINFDLLTAMLSSTPIALLDFKLEKEVLAEDEMYAYVKEAFKEYKVNNGLTLATVMKYMNTIDLNPLMKELKDSVGDLNKLAQKQ